MFKKREPESVFSMQENFISILKNISQYLIISNNLAQSEFIEKLIDLLNDGEIDEFIKDINGIDMWGGAGAVWEVYIDDGIDQIRFEKEMLSLIELMKKTDILGSGIKSIENLFIKNLKT